MPSDTPRLRRFFPRVVSAIVVALGVALLEIKGFFAALFVNPFEGFGAAQYTVAGGSILLTIAAYAWQKYPIGLIVGFVVITLIHEIGHAIVIRAKGLRAGFLVFIPFIGGAVTLKDQPRSAYDDAQIGLAGPIFGTAACLVVLQIFKWTNDPRWLGIDRKSTRLNS